MAKTKVKVIVALFAVIALSLLAVCFGRLFSPAEAKAADGTYDDTAAVELMTALATNNEVTLTQDVVFDLTVPSGITGSGTMKKNGHMDIVGNKTIDLAGFTLTIITGSENCCVEVTPNASLTIKDLSAAGTGKVVGQSAGDFAWGQTGTSISLTNVDVEFTSTEEGEAGDEGSTTPGGSSEDHVILSNGSVELSGVTFNTNVSDPVAVFTKDTETGEFVGTDVTYGTLQDAINATGYNEYIQVSEKIKNVNAEEKSVTESIVIPEGQKINLDLNGYTLKNVEEAGKYAAITNNGELYVYNGTIAATSAAKMSSSNDDDYIPYGIYNNGTLIARNVEINATATGSGNSEDKPTAKVSIKAYGIYNNAGSVTISGGKVYASSASYNSYALYNTKGALNINGGEYVVEDKSGSLTVYTIYSLNSGSSIKINGGTFKADGGTAYGMYIKSGSEISNATIAAVGKKTTYGIYANTCDVKISDSSITATTNAKNAGAHGIQGAYKVGLTLSDVAITAKAEQSIGRCISSNNSSASFTALSISGEDTVLSAISGAEYKSKSYAVSIYGSEEKPEFTFEDGTVKSGGFELGKGTTTKILSGTFEEATFDVNATATLSISGGTFAEMPSPTYLASDEHAIYRNGEAGSYTYEIAAISSKPDVKPYRTLNDKVTVGDRGFDSVAAAVKAINDGTATGPITLIASVEEDIVVTSGSVAIDLNGNTVTGNVSVSNGATLSIEGVGKVTGMVSSEGTLTISGGTFGQLLPKEWLATGTALSVNDDLAFTVVQSETIATMTKADDTSYIFDSLQSATYAAPIGEEVTITLEKDITADGKLISASDNRIINYDLNGKKITFTEAADDQTVITLNSGTYTFTNGTITRVRPDGWSEGKVNAIFEIFVGTSTSPRANVTFGEDFTAEATNGASVAYIYNYANLTVDGATLKSDTDWTIHGFGGEQIGEQQTTINIKNGTVESTGAAAIYQPQVGGTINVSGGTVRGVTGIEIRNGALNVTGGTIIATGGFSASGTPSGGGSTVSGAAVAVTKYNNNETLTVNISGGELIAEGANGHAVYEGYPDSEDGKYPEGNELSLTVSSGEFTGAVDSKNETGFISGGNFSEVLDSAYLGENVNMYVSEGKYTAATENNKPDGAQKVVATVNGKGYASLQAAIDAADGAIVTLYDDVTLSETIVTTENVTIDFAGKTIATSVKAITATNGAVVTLSDGTITYTGSDETITGLVAETGAKLVLNKMTVSFPDGNVAIRLGDGNGGDGGMLELTDSTVYGGAAGVGLFGSNNAEAPSSMTAKNSKIYYTKSFGISTNGSFANNAITLENTDILMNGDVPTGAGIYLAGAGTTDITGGTIEGATGIEIRAGKLTINEGTIVKADGDYAVEPNGNGSTVVGVAIAVSQHTTERPIEVTVNGGEFSATGTDGKAFYETDTVTGETEPSEDVTITIDGGNFKAPVESENKTGFVEGGNFTEVLAPEYVSDTADLYVTANGYAVYDEGDTPAEGDTKVIAMVGDKAYDKLADAVAAATDDGAVTLYVDVKENITVASGTVTIDLAGNTLNGFIKSTGATVNVKNGTVSGSWIDGAVMANGEGASVTLTDTVIGNPISISNDGAVTLVRSTTRGRITVGSGSAPENYTAGTLTITDSIIEKEISVEMLGKVVISDTVEYKTSFASGVKVTAKDPAALEAFKGYGVTTVVHVANEEQLLKALELGVSEIEVQSMELSAPVEITKDVKIYGGNKGDHEIVGSFIVKGEIEVTIEDVSFAGDGTGAALTVTDGAKLTYSDNLSNVTVAVSGFEAGISVDGNSSATVNNITFENISAAAEVKDGKSDAVTFNGCTIPEDTAQYVAVVTDATNLASAIADSKFAKVTLGADVELTSALVIERSVTLDLNGYDITGNINVTAADVTITAPETSDSAINGIVTVTNADDFTLSNVTVNYTVTGEEEADSLKMGAVVIDGSENATIDNVTVNVTANNSGLNVVSVWVKNDSTATISDSTIDLEFRATKENRTQGQVVRAETSDLTIKDSVITTTDYGVIFYGDMSATDAQADNTAAFDKLVIENSTVTVTDTDKIVGAYAVSGNGSNRNGTIIEITGSTITSDVATAIYHPQYGNMTITDSVITGASGIEMRSGNLTVTSGTITATGAFEVEPNGNGNTASGVAVAVSQHTTEMKINVQLNGGTFNATGENGKAFYETDTVTGADPSADVTVDLNGGTYEAAVEAKNIKNFINDGLYKEEPKEDAFAEGYEGVLYNGYYQVVEATTDDPAALLTAKTEAQADVRSYLLNACGMTIADVKALAADETLGAAAQAVIDAYAAMDGATSESKLAIARLSVMDAIDALDKALDTALADYKAAAIDKINSYGAEKDVAVPTATIMAINSAKTEAEVDMYKEYAIGEIDDIVAYREAISNIKIPDYSDTLDDLSAKLDTLTGNLTSVSNTLGEKIDAVKTDIATVTADIDKLETTLAGLADSDDVNGIAEDISDIIEQLAAIKSTVDGISVAVDEATAVEEVKTEAAAEIDAWLEDYIDSIVESSATSVRDILTAKAAMADALRSKLVDAFGEDNAALIEKYYDDAMSAIENATSASEATNAVSTFKAQVASVEAAAGNTTSLAGVYVLLAIILVVAIVAVVLAVVLKRKGGEPAPAAAQPAPEAAPAPAPAAETATAPAATEEAPAAQPEDESAATATDEDTERVVITASTRTFEEAYEALDPELRDLFDKVKAYALSKNGTTEVKLSNCICIKYGSKKVVRLTVRRSYPLAMFVIENEMVKDFRRNATGALKLKVPATELVIRDEEDLKAAYSMVDLAVDQILKDIEAAKERRRAARRARRAQREAEAGEAGETPEAPEAPDDGGKK